MKLTKNLFVLFALLALCSSVAAFFTAGDTSFAVTSAAKTYCTSKYPENSSGAIDARNACQSAFDTSYKYGTISSAKCSSSKNKDACETGASAGKAAKISFTNSVKQTGTDGANNNKSQVDSCSKYHNATNISTCKKAWSAQVIVKAKETAVNAKSADDCKGILGGSKAEKACKEAFTKAKNAADAAGINKCDTVVTYFDFDCGSAKTTSGGRQNPIVSLLLTVLSWVTGLVSMAAIGGIIYGGILYAGAQDNSGQTQKGIMYVVNSTIALLLWFAAFALINYIVPGGLFS